MRRMTLVDGIVLSVAALTLIAAPVAGATTYNNDTPINIGISAAPADPYPSSITVSGTAGPITDVNIGLDGFTHTAPTDVSIALVAPSGHALRIQGCSGSAFDVAGVNLTFDDASGTELPELAALTTGIFQPTSHCVFNHSFPPPGPTVSYGNPGPGLGGIATFASVFNGLSAIGTWKLYVTDLTATDSGSIPGGWSLDVAPDVTPPPPPTPPPTPTPTLTPTTSLTPAPAQKCKKKKKKKCKKKKK